MLSPGNADDKELEIKQTVIFESAKVDGKNVVSVRTKGLRILARSVTFEDGKTIASTSNGIKFQNGNGKAIATAIRLEVTEKVIFKDIDLIRIEIDPLEN